MKRGIGHVEFILAFVLFSGLVLFALIFLYSSKNSEFVNSAMSYSFRQVEDYISGDMTQYSIKLEGPSGPVIIDFPNAEVFKNKGVRVESTSGAKLLCKSSDGNVIVDAGSDKFIIIKASAGMTNQCDAPITSSSPAIYQLASQKNVRILTVRNATKLETAYTDDYINTKDELQLNRNIDFKFSLNFDEGEDIDNAQRKIPVGVETFIKADRKEILKEDGQVVFGDLVVAVW